uniref:LOB domain-containing protein n=1 Tax=Tanacetum cinerariifolium TaxID=118510 RepID=A0A6L2L936_TANCI|nr:hypothetical protein [Tanacetum cinerariifolium]
MSALTDESLIQRLNVRAQRLNNALNNEAVKDGVVPSDMVASGINNDTQDENLGQCPSTCPSASASRPASVSFATLMKGDSSRNFNFRTLITHARNEANMAVMLESIRVLSTHREEALNSSAYEADARLKDPVYGCAGYISNLIQDIELAKIELAKTKAELALRGAAVDPFF